MKDEYGEEILATLSQELTVEYGRGWSKRNLAYMIRFAEVFPDEQILQTLCAKLSWSHFRQVVSMDDPLKPGQSGIHVAEYLTTLPSREMLQKKLHVAIELPRQQLVNGEAE